MTVWKLSNVTHSLYFHSYWSFSFERVKDAPDKYMLHTDLERKVDKQEREKGRSYSLIIYAKTFKL